MNIFPVDRPQHAASPRMSGTSDDRLYERELLAQQIGELLAMEWLKERCRPDHVNFFQRE
jgi:hypothetical protein